MLGSYIKEDSVLILVRKFSMIIIMLQVTTYNDGVIIFLHI